MCDVAHDVPGGARRGQRPVAANLGSGARRLAPCPPRRPGRSVDRRRGDRSAPARRLHHRGRDVVETTDCPPTLAHTTARTPSPRQPPGVRSTRRSGSGSARSPDHAAARTGNRRSRGWWCAPARRHRQIRANVGPADAGEGQRPTAGARRAAPLRDRLRRWRAGRTQWPAPLRLGDDGAGVRCGRGLAATTGAEHASAPGSSVGAGCRLRSRSPRRRPRLPAATVRARRMGRVRRARRGRRPRRQRRALPTHPAGCAVHRTHRRGHRGPHHAGTATGRCRRDEVPPAPRRPIRLRPRGDPGAGRAGGDATWTVSSGLGRCRGADRLGRCGCAPRRRPRPQPAGAHPGPRPALAHRAVRPRPRRRLHARCRR